MIGLVCLAIAVLCALISRVLLFIAAINISVWWALGVFLPFGPTLFRFNYPEAARSSYLFRLGTLLCFFLYVVFWAPGALVGPVGKTRSHNKNTVHSGYASELGKKFISFNKPTNKINAQSLEQRRAANDREFERLGRWNAALTAQKHDLVPTDVEGNHAYNIDLGEYNAALAAAAAEKQVLAAHPGK
jgi:hypothetical protein